MKDGCLTTHDQAYAGRNRRYYQITEARQSRSAAAPHRLAELPQRDRHDLFWRGERMNRADYMAALRRALSVLPEEERANALRYYEEYFDDAGRKNEAKAIEELGEPAKVAAQILADYRELTAVPHAQPIKEKRRWRGISPLLLIVLVLLAIPIGLPLVFGAGATVLWRASGDRCDRARGDFRCTAHSVRHSACADLRRSRDCPAVLHTVGDTGERARHTRQRTGCLCRRYPCSDCCPSS